MQSSCNANAFHSLFVLTQSLQLQFHLQPSLRWYSSDQNNEIASTLDMPFLAKKVFNFKINIRTPASQPVA